MLSMPLTDLVTGFISFFLTLMILSYLVGDNPLFRMAVYIFVGVSAGYAASIAWQQVLWPRLFQPMIFGSMQERLFLLVPLLMGILLMTKLSQGSVRLANPVMAFLVGTAAAIAIGGAIFGTLIPQTQASIDLFDTHAGGSFFERLFEGSVFLVGTISTLVYFHFGAKKRSGEVERSRWIVKIGWVGSIFIAITFGVLFAGVYAAAMTALIERMYSLWTFILALF